MIINAGIKKFIGNNPDNSISVYNISDWVEEWQDLDDITQDKNKYKCDYNNNKTKKTKSPIVSAMPSCITGRSGRN